MRRSSIVIGFIAALALLGLFLLVVTALSGWQTTAGQFGRFWPFLILLALGFGAQVALAADLRRTVRSGSRAVVAVSGSTSTAAMLSCCTHYLVNLLPLIGISGASGLAAFAGKYQLEFFWIGLVINAVAVMIIVRRWLRAREQMRTSCAPAAPSP